MEVPAGERWLNAGQQSPAIVLHLRDEMCSQKRPKLHSTRRVTWSGDDEDNSHVHPAAVCREDLNTLPLILPWWKTTITLSQISELNILLRKDSIFRDMSERQSLPSIGSEKGKFTAEKYIECSSLLTSLLICIPPNIEKSQRIYIFCNWKLRWALKTQWKKVPATAKH